MEPLIRITVESLAEGKRKKVQSISGFPLLDLMVRKDEMTPKMAQGGLCALCFPKLSSQTGASAV